jgi:hypothetical protein
MRADDSRKLRELRLAHEAMMLGDAQQLLKQDRQTVAAQRQQPEAGTDDMIHVGDVTQHIHPTPRAGIGPLLATALALAGLAAGAAGPLAWMALAQRHEVKQEQKVEDVELEVRWKLGPDGKWETVVEPVRK